FLAMQPYGTTELSIAHTIQKIDPLVHIDFQKTELPQTPLTAGSFLLGKEYPLLKKIQESYTTFLNEKDAKQDTSHTQVSFSPLAVQKKHKKQKKRTLLWFGILLVAFIIFFSPVICTLIYALSGASLLYGAKSTFSTGNFQQATTFAKTGENMFALAGQTNVFAEKELSL